MKQENSFKNLQISAFQHIYLLKNYILTTVCARFDFYFEHDLMEKSDWLHTICVIVYADKSTSHAQSLYH